MSRTVRMTVDMMDVPMRSKHGLFLVVGVSCQLRPVHPKGYQPPTLSGIMYIDDMQVIVGLVVFAP